MQFRFDTTTITVNIANRATLFAAVAQRFVAGDGFALSTINLDHLVKLRRSPAFRAVYAVQDFVVADGNPIVWLSRLARQPVELVPGSDMVIPLVRLAVQHNRRVALIGTTEPALRTAASAIESKIPGLHVALTIAPPMGFDPQGPEAKAILARLAAADIGFCVLALPVGKQEVLSTLGRSLTPHTGFANFGAGLDFLVAAKPAPRAGCARWRWSGCGARSPIPAGCCHAMPPALPSFPARSPPR